MFHSRRMRLFGNYDVTKYALAFLAAGFFFVSIVAYALDTVSFDIASQSATGSGGTNNLVWFSTGTTSTGTQYTIQYMNKDNDSASIGNYLQGYYYDSVYGFFKLDWDSATPDNNIHIIDSTDKCPTGYGYKFGGYAEGVDAGYVDFDYDSSTYVYFCESDQKLHGYAYNPNLWLQSFEGISMSVVSSSTNIPNLPNVFNGPDPFFSNNSSILLLQNHSTPSLQGDISSSDWGKSAIFYIVK